MAHRLVSALCNVSLFPHQGMRDTQVDLRGQVAPQLLTERAVHHDGLKRERRYASRNLTTALLARHYKLLSLDNWESECHETSIGEDVRAATYPYPNR